MVESVEFGVYYRVKGVGFRSIVRVRVQGGIVEFKGAGIGGRC